jgi:hypothetical protein
MLALLIKSFGFALGVIMVFAGTMSASDNPTLIILGAAILGLPAILYCEPREIDSIAIGNSGIMVKPAEIPVVEESKHKGRDRDLREVYDAPCEVEQQVRDDLKKIKAGA